MSDATRTIGGRAHGGSPVPLLTIGYGGERSSEEFVDLLTRYGVQYLIDVRTKPYSKFRPEFSKDALEAIVRRAGLSYLFMGDSLGGMPTDPTCYTGGKVDYSKVAERDWFQRGITRLETAWKAGHRVAIMCAELEPDRCHRSKLVGEALIARGVPVDHIDEDGDVISHQAVLDRLTGGQGALFDTGMTSRKRYGPTRGPDAEVAPCVANLDNILTVPRARLTELAGSLAGAKVQQLNAALRTSLGL